MVDVVADGAKFSGFEELPLDNMITNVEYDEYNIFVYFGDKRFDLEADDGWGNGCYGGGFTVTVKKDEVWEIKSILS